MPRAYLVRSRENQKSAPLLFRVAYALVFPDCKSISSLANAFLYAS